MILRILYLAIVLPLFSCQTQPGQSGAAASFIDGKGVEIHRLNLTNKQWEERLSPEEFNVLRRQGTELAFSGEFWDSREAGVYTCAGCGLELFASVAKFKSGTGWPSFYEPIDETHIEREPGSGFGMFGIEVHCNKCGGHLGHVFNDGPQPTGLRYCINSVSLDFEEAE